MYATEIITIMYQPKTINTVETNRTIQNSVFVDVQLLN